MYKVDPIKASPLYLSMLAATGSTVLTSGFYVLALSAGLTQLRALGYTMLLSSAFAVKFIATEAEALGVKTAALIGPLAWRTAVQLALAVLALCA